jgi:hypothetical protein
MEGGTQSVVVAVPRMHERGGSGSRAGGRLLVVRCESRRRLGRHLLPRGSISLGPATQRRGAGGCVVVGGQAGRERGYHLVSGRVPLCAVGSCLNALSSCGLVFLRWVTISSCCLLTIPTRPTGDGRPHCRTRTSDRRPQRDLRRRQPRLLGPHRAPRTRRSRPRRHGRRSALALRRDDQRQRRARDKRPRGPSPKRRIDGCP